MKKYLAIIPFLFCLNSAAEAQSTAAQVVIGYYSTSGCKTGETVCFIQLGPTIPVSITGGSSSLLGVKGTDGSTIAAPANPFPTTPYDSNGAQANFSSTASVQSVSQYPVGSSPITGNATGTTGAVVGTLAGVALKTTYICGLNISATGGVATLGPITVAGLVGSSMTFQLFSTATGANLTWNFSQCIPASAQNTPITITTTADGTASAVDVNSFGYQL